MIDYARGAGRAVNREVLGRTVIIERTRAALRKKPMVDLQREEIAKYARMTPALISYYFPDRSSLFEAAAQPVIDEYVDAVRKIIANDDELTSKLRSLVALYVNFNYDEGYLFDFYLAHCKKFGDLVGLEHLKVAHEQILGFFDQLLQKQVLRGDSPSTLQAMLWGMCKNVAEKSREKICELNNELLATKADAIFDCFVNGAAGLVITQRIAKADLNSCLATR